MSLLVNIDTSSETAFVSLTNNDSIIGFVENAIQKEHAAFLHPAIQELMKQAGKSFQELDAIAVTAGPGSYTGIRVGMATAKGLCFAINKPLITLNSLEILARDVMNNHPADEDFLYCPLIDARRMEVFTALYDRDGNDVVSPAAMVIDEDCSRIFSTKHKLIAFGSGSDKCKNHQAFKDVIFTQNVNISHAMAELSFEKYARKAFTDLILSEPFYLKEFYDNRS